MMCLTFTSENAEKIKKKVGHEYIAERVQIHNNSVHGNWFCWKYCFDNSIVCLWVLTQAMTGTYSPSPSPCMDALSLVCVSSPSVSLRINGGGRW